MLCPNFKWKLFCVSYIQGVAKYSRVPCINSLQQNRTLKRTGNSFMFSSVIFDANCENLANFAIIRNSLRTTYYDFQLYFCCSTLLLLQDKYAHAQAPKRMLSLLVRFSLEYTSSSWPSLIHTSSTRKDKFQTESSKQPLVSVLGMKSYSNFLKKHSSYGVGKVRYFTFIAIVKNITDFFSFHFCSKYIYLMIAADFEYLFINYIISNDFVTLIHLYWPVACTGRFNAN